MLIPLLTVLAWAAPAQEPDALPAFQDVCFDDFEQQNGYPGQAQLKRLLAQVPGHDYKFQPTQAWGDRHACQISGVFQVQQPWQAGTAMRFHVFTYRTLRVFLWRGNQGVALMYFPNANQQWSAYGTTRSDNKPQPKTYAFWGGDEGRYLQSGSGTVTALYQDRHLYLTRGNLLLLAVPFDEPPTEVFLDAEGLVRGLHFFQCTGAPAAPKPRPVVTRIDKPAEAAWDVRAADGITFSKLPDGSVELTAKEKTPAGRAAVTVCTPGLHEFIFQVEDAEIGAGIYFGDSEGNPVERVACMRASGTQANLMRVADPTDGTVEQWIDVNLNSPIPFVGKRQWIRVIAGAGVWKCSMSGDGVHWSQFPADFAGAQRPPCTQVGLCCIAGEKKRSIKLRSIQVRRLDALWSLAPEAMQQRVAQQVSGLGVMPAPAPDGSRPPIVPLAKIGSVETWLQVVGASRPADVTPEVWQRACTLHTLANGPAPPLYQALLFRLLDDLVAGPWELDQKLQALDQAALLLKTSDQNTANQLGDCYGKLAQELVRQGHAAPFTAVSSGLLRAPIAMRVWARVPWEDLLTMELFPLVYQNRWAQVDEICRRVRFWQEPRRLMNGLPADELPLAELSGWAGAAIPRSGSPPRGERVALAGWRLLLIPPLSKEAYNTIAELEGALQGQAYREACQAITSTPNPLALGLAADSTDRRLLVSYPVAVRLAMDRVPALRKSMEESFLKVGRIRLQGAIQTGDELAVETVAAQFPGTEAAVESHLWLGDHALSGGRFAYAIGHYEQGLSGAAPAQRAALAARARLAAALLGRDVAAAAKQPVQFGDVKYSAEQFEQLVAELRQARGGSDFSPYFTVAAQSAPPPGRYQAQSWARFDPGDVPPPPSLPDPAFDWGARQTAVALTAQQMIVSRRAYLAAYHPADGRMLWQQRLQTDKNLQQLWPTVPLRPAAGSSRVVVRRPVKEGLDLTCLDAANGAILWSNNPDGCVASDPLLSGDDLYALTLRTVYPQKLLLSLTRLNAATGEMLKQTPLAEFLDVRHGVLPCEAAAIDDRIVATVGGCVLCCEQSGRVQWMRQQVWVPPRDETTAQSWRPAYLQAHDPPLVEGGRVYATQPGMRSVECLDLATGRLLWQQTIPRLSRVLGLVGKRLVVSGASELLGLDSSSGQIVWRYDAPERLEGYLCGPPGGVLFIELERTAGAGAVRRPVLKWLDPADGRPLGESVVNGVPQVKAMFGPMLSQGNRQWLLFAAPPNLAMREIWALAPSP